MFKLWGSFTNTWENSRVLRLVLQLVLMVGIVFTGFKAYQVLFNQEDLGGVVEEEVQQEEVYGKISEETLHILENPERYEGKDIAGAYQETLTTYDDEFVEKNVFNKEYLGEGIYLYHEKANEHYKEVARLAEDISKLGVSVYFYTPQNDQTIASLSNQVDLLNEEGNEMVVKAVIVRGEEETEKIEDEGEVLEYLEGVIDANRDNKE